jgi:hypothetical protein
MTLHSKIGEVIAHVQAPHFGSLNHHSPQRAIDNRVQVLAFWPL